MKKMIVFSIVLLTSSICFAETVRVVYKPDKSILVINPTKGDYESRVIDSMVAMGAEHLPYDDIDSSQLPQTIEKRNYWEGEKGKPITINEVKYQADQAAKPKTAEQRLAELETKVDTLEKKP